MRFIIIMLLVIFSFGNNKKVNICDDIAGWAPYMYVKNNKLKGFSIALLNEIFKRMDMTYSINLIPWKRCLYLVEYYNKTHKYEMFLDGSYTKQRDKKYYHSIPIYYTHQAIFYSDKKFTKNKILNIVKNDVNKLKMCDVYGYQTEHYKNVLGYTNEKRWNLSKTISKICTRFYTIN